jgi:endonuclease/exonuclease/phosphatase family metal-dependent hydrolase
VVKALLLLLASAAAASACGARGNGAVGRPAPPGALRVATFNASLATNQAGGLVARLKAGDEAARAIAAVVQTVRPDLLLLNEFDYDERGEAAAIFRREYLGVGQRGRAAIAYPFVFSAPVNTGVPSGLDLDRDGKTGGPNDAWGFGFHPGQYGMLVLSRFPIDEARVRTFQTFKWRDMPGALAPLQPDGTPYYPPPAWEALPLSSKSHWDVPVAAPSGTLHFLVAHPTPPVFDGPEDRNGRRNHDEIRFWADYLEAETGAYIYDDRGARGGLAAGSAFVIAGDLNADPVDGDGVPGTMQQLLSHPAVRSVPRPGSAGAVEAAREDAGINLRHLADPRTDTGSFGPQVGNLRIDYVLPAKRFRVIGAGVFWPVRAHPDAALLGASDHRLVWLDIRN